MSDIEPPNSIPTQRVKSDSESEVGYGKPPRKNRFRLGQSGNLKGRPKGSMSIGKRLEKMLNARVSISIDGISRTKTYSDLITLSLIKFAARGSIAHIRLIKELEDKFGLNEPKKLPTYIVVSFVKPPIYPADEELTKDPSLY